MYPQKPSYDIIHLNSLFFYKIINKFGMNNIYFDKIKAWTISIFILIILMLFMYLPIPFIRDNFYNGYIVSSLFYIYILFVILYRPAFLNKSSMKISLGDSFSKNADFIINDLDFITNFFTHFYFTNPDASLENFAKVLNVGSNDLYKFVYYKYNMTFNDLVNKHRVEYFIDIIHNPKFLNYTIDALAKEAGFSSRQHLYKPFKKFHGGNPSDLIDSIAQLLKYSQDEIKQIKLEQENAREKRKTQSEKIDHMYDLLLEYISRSK